MNRILDIFLKFFMTTIELIVYVYPNYPIYQPLRLGRI